MGRYLFFLAVSILLALAGAGCGDTEAPVPAAPDPAVPSPWEGTIVAMGDSLTAGLGVDETRAYPARLQAQLEADGYRFRVINAGVSGETSSGALSRLDWVLTLTPDLVILETGANDGLRGIAPALVGRNIDEIVTRLQDRKVMVVLAGMKMVRSLGPHYTDAFERIYPAVAEAKGVMLVPFFLEGVAGVPDLNQADGIHPTAAGYAKVADHLYPIVRKAVDRLRTTGPKPPEKEGS
jgi:acyl-CoA thioesterase I